jgi:3-deoxy-7-phosphoheptulonate synthase
VVVVGPCSIHDTRAAVDYARRLLPLKERYERELIVTMRSYFEKPRTSVGWKGLINDPDLDESFHINKGLRLARQLLVDLNDMGLPTASEFLDTQIPQYIADLTSWVAIGAAHHREPGAPRAGLGLSMPVGFKNGTDGSTQTAVDAVLSARSPHLFPSVTKQGVSAIFETSGNDTCHVILRGGSRTGPNFDASHVDEVCGRLRARGLRETVMIDCSHANSQKDHRKQSAVSASIAEQVAAGSWRLMGAMLESHLVEGRQDYVPGRPPTARASPTRASRSSRPNRCSSCSPRRNRSEARSEDVPRSRHLSHDRCGDRVGVFVAGAAAAQIPRPPAAADGAELFATTCQVCHGQAGIGGVGPALRGAKFTADYVRKVLQEGRPGTMMPGFTATMSPGEIGGISPLRRPAAGARWARAWRSARRRQRGPGGVLPEGLGAQLLGVPLGRRARRLGGT